MFEHRQLLFFFASFIIILLFVSFANSNSVNLGTVRVDDDLVDKFEEFDGKINFIVKLNSGGGLPQDALKISDIMLRNKTGVIINRACLSACAETILPSATIVEFQNTPIIGFHWNSTMNFDMLRRYGGDLRLCDLTTVERQKSLLSTKGMNVDFWKETEKRLVLEHYEIVPRGYACPWKRREFKNHMWLPTSEQLRNLWGLEFKGSVCADDFQRCTWKIDRRWKKGTRIVVGDEVYISRGQSIIYNRFSGARDYKPEDS